MNTITLGVRNAFRNATRSLSIIIILGLAIGLSLVMLIAHQAVGQKIADAKSSIGDTITISPAGFSQFSQANNALTTSQLGKVNSLTHVTNVTEALTDRLTTIGSSQPSFGPKASSDISTNNQTSLKSPVKINSGKGNGFHVFVNGGSSSLPTNFSPPISIIGTNDPTNLANVAGAGNITVTSGKMISGTSNTNDSMIGQSMASKNSLKVGSTFTAYGKTLTVTGIFKSSTDAGGNNVVVSLPTEQRLSGQSDDVTSAVATVDSVDNLSSTTTAIKNTLGSNADVTNSQDEVNQTIQPLNSVKNIALYSLVGAVIAGSIIILLTMIMIVRERRREIGVLKAIGASNARVIFQFMSEAVTLTIAGALIGIIIGVIGSNPVTNTLVTNASNSSSSTNQQTVGPGGQGPSLSVGGGRQNFGARPTTGRNFFGRNANSLDNSVRNVHANVGWNILAYGLGAAVLIAIIGSSLAGWLIARVRPSEVMRQE
ncbi:MAG TPA: ABC transporter permease [Candidatus Saccharimonadales bacterium]|jgi:putative ABC transport system permease protein